MYLEQNKVIMGFIQCIYVKGVGKIWQYKIMNIYKKWVRLIRLLYYLLLENEKEIWTRTNI